MYRPTSTQRQLWEKDALLDERSRRRLVASWAESFQRRVLPVLLEEEEEIGPQLYADIGRPTWSVARMLGRGCASCASYAQLGSDEETVTALSFDLRWQHALGLSADEDAGPVTE